MLGVIMCDVCCIVLYCIVFIVLNCPVLHCSTLPPGINPVVVNNNNNNWSDWDNVQIIQKIRERHIREA